MTSADPLLELARGLKDYLRLLDRTGQRWLVPGRSIAPAASTAAAEVGAVAAEQEPGEAQPLPPEASDPPHELLLTGVGNDLVEVLPPPVDEVSLPSATAEAAQPGDVSSETGDGSMQLDLFGQVAEETVVPFGSGTPEPPSPAASSAPVAAAAKAREPGLPAAQRVAALNELSQAVAICTKCVLAQGRTQTVFGEGDPSARLMFIGEGPGFNEDQQGRPFVGRAGQLLDRMIAAMGLRREQVYIANAVKCRPPDNRTPAPEECAACEPYLRRQIDLIRPEVICLLGAVASRLLLKTTLPMKALRGRWHTYDAIPVVVTYHPAYLLRNPADKSKAWDDLKMAMKRLGLSTPSKPGMGP